MQSANEPFTAREREVYLLLLKRFTNKEIADTLVISERTVETHVASVLEKLSLHDRHEVAPRAKDQY
jgi:DNA-binding NarL/FixJ family response regulator